MWHISQHQCMFKWQTFLSMFLQAKSKMLGQPNRVRIIFVVIYFTPASLYIETNSLQFCTECIANNTENYSNLSLGVTNKLDSKESQKVLTFQLIFHVIQSKPVCALFTVCVQTMKAQIVQVCTYIKGVTEGSQRAGWSIESVLRILKLKGFRLKCPFHRPVSNY